MKKAVRQSYQNSKQNFNTPEICKEHDDLVREFQSLKRYKKCSFEQITIENNIARAETDLNQFWQFWKRSQSKTSPMQVQPELWQSHFSTILQSDTPVVLPNPLPSLSNDILDAPITETDVLTAISHCKCNKSPGPDGITYDCYKDAADILLQPLTALFNYIFSHGTCPSAWLVSNLIALYKGKGSLSSPDSYRGIALQICALKLYTYILSQRRLYVWAEVNHLIPESQHGFRSLRSTQTAIFELNNLVQNSLSQPKVPLYVVYVDFTKAFDSIDRTLLLQKLVTLGISDKFANALFALLRENFIRVSVGDWVSEPIKQDKGVPQGECLSPLLFSLFTSDLPATLMTDNDIAVLMYADDLAICSNNRTKLQTSLDHLSTFCASNKLMVNISKTKAMKFRRGGRMSTDDKLSYNGSPLEFLSSFTYLGVVFQTRGGTGGHTDHLRSKGLSSCGKISMRLPLSKLSLPSLERLFLSIVLPSMSYALGTLIQLNPNLTYIDEIQGRLLKMWFGVSKYASSTALMSAVGWTPISDSVKESLLNGTPIGLIRVENAPDLGNGRTRRNLGLWHTNGLHQLWCKSHKCYRPTADCTCRLCNDRHVDKWHLQTCAWLINDDISFTVSLTTINQLCQTLYATNPSI